MVVSDPESNSALRGGLLLDLVSGALSKSAVIAASTAGPAAFAEAAMF
jgi:hypothetical protein